VSEVKRYTHVNGALLESANGVLCMAKDVAALQSRLAEVEERTASLEKCSTCGGTPHPSGLTCICGGTGLSRDEVHGLRLKCFELSKELAEVEGALVKISASTVFEHYANVDLAKAALGEEVMGESVAPDSDYCTRCERKGFELFFVEYRNGYDAEKYHNIRANSVCRDCREQLDNLIEAAIKTTASPFHAELDRLTATVQSLTAEREALSVALDKEKKENRLALACIDTLAEVETIFAKIEKLAKWPQTKHHLEKPLTEQVTQ